MLRRTFLKAMGFGAGAAVAGVTVTVATAAIEHKDQVESSPDGFRDVVYEKLRDEARKKTPDSPTFAATYQIATKMFAEIQRRNRKEGFQTRLIIKPNQVLHDELLLVPKGIQYLASEIVVRDGSKYETVMKSRSVNVYGTRRRAILN